jgi:hypothetical protein
MSEAPNPKPRPARAPGGEAVPPTPKPTPARELGTDPGPNPPPTPGGAPAPPAPKSGGAVGAPDIAEAILEVGGARWRIKVLGRSGRSGDRSPPLLLLGFWDADGTSPGHAREATIVARTLSELGPNRLEEALASSSPPPAIGRKPFFEGPGPARRGGPSRDDS